MNFRHEVNRSQMETFVIDDVLYLMALGLFEKGCQQVIRHDLNFVFQYLAFYTVDVFDYPIEIALTINLWSLSFCLLIFVLGIH